MAREWAPGEMTASGYPFVVKRMLRGQPLSAATEVFRGKPTDVEVDPFSVADGAGHHADFILRGVTFFESEQYLVTPKGAVKLALPAKSHIAGTGEAGRLVIVSLDEDWTVAGQAFKQGSLVALDLDAVPRRSRAPEADAHLTPPARGIRSTEASATKDRLIVTTLDNVRGRAFVYTPTAGGGWTYTKARPARQRRHRHRRYGQPQRPGLPQRHRLPDALHRFPAGRPHRRAGRGEGACPPSSMRPRTRCSSSRPPPRTAPRSPTSSSTRRA